MADDMMRAWLMTCSHLSGDFFVELSHWLCLPECILFLDFLLVDHGSLQGGRKRSHLLGLNLDGAAARSSRICIGIIRHLNTMQSIYEKSVMPWDWFLAVTGPDIKVKDLKLHLPRLVWFRSHFRI